MIGVLTSVEGVPQFHLAQNMVEIGAIQSILLVESDRKTIAIDIGRKIIVADLRRAAPVNACCESVLKRENPSGLLRTARIFQAHGVQSRNTSATDGLYMPQQTLVFR